MDEDVLEKARLRIEEARTGGSAGSRFEAALDRSRAEVESLARAAAELERALPDRVGAAIRDGVSREVIPVSRNLAEIRGLLNRTLGRLERLEHELLAERSARIDDLAVLVDLVAAGWKGVDARLDRIERDSASAKIVPIRTGAA